MSSIGQRINKDLILREKLAIERTDMAIDRTLLSYIRTALYFSIAGITINSLLKPSYGLWLEIAFWIAAFIIFATGLRKYRQQKLKLKANERHIGNYQLEWEEDID